jgi:uncharacterized protein (TIGR00251 family)
VDERKFRLHDGKSGSAMTVRVIPKATKNEVVEILNDGTVKVRLAAPADETKLNQVLLEFLAGVLQVPQSHLEIVAGTNGPDKIVSVIDIDAGKLQERILAKIG